MGKFNKLFEIDKFAINLAGIYLSLVRFPKKLKYKKLLYRNKEIIHKRKSDKCYVCGLGSSLKQVDLKKLDGDTLVVNRFYKFDKDNSFCPTYYCVIDDSFAELKYRDELLKIINSYKDTTFILNASLFDILNKKFPNNKNLYYQCAWKGTFNSNKNIDFSNIIPIMGNVISNAIAFSLYLGYKEIVLLGCDFNTFASQKEDHCYDVVDNKRTITLAFELFCYSFVADTHYELQKYAKKNGVTIINATQGSLLDAYVRDENYVSKIN